MRVFPRFRVFALGLLAAFFCVPAVCAETIWLRGVRKSSGWFDCEKSPKDSGDDFLCWAAAASNSVAYWNKMSDSKNVPAGTPTKNTEIFSEFKKYFVNTALDPRYAYGWYFGGVKINDYLLKETEKANAGGKYWEDYVVRTKLADPNSVDPKYVKDDTVVNTYDARGREEKFFRVVKKALKVGYPVTLMIAPPGASGHAISLWGAEANEKGELTKLYITDSDDGKKQLACVNVLIRATREQHGDGKDGKPFELWDNTQLFLGGYMFGENYRIVSYSVLTLPPAKGVECP